MGVRYAVACRREPVCPCSNIRGSIFTGGSRLSLAITAVAALLALFTHEYAVMIPVVILVYALISKRVPRERMRALALCCLTALGVWFVSYHHFYAAQNHAICEVGEPSLLSPSSVYRNMRVALPGLLMPNLESPAVQHRLPEVPPWAVGPLGVLWTGACFVSLAILILALLRGTWLGRFGSIWCLLGVRIAPYRLPDLRGAISTCPIIGFVLVLAAIYSNINTSLKQYTKTLLLFVCILIMIFNVAATQMIQAFLARNGANRARLISQIRSAARSCGPASHCSIRPAQEIRC